MIGNGNKHIEEDSFFEEDIFNDETNKASVETANESDIKYIDITYNGNHEELIETITDLSEQALNISQNYSYNSIPELVKLRNKLNYYLLDLSKLYGSYILKHKMAHTKRKNRVASLENNLMATKNKKTGKYYTSTAAKQEVENDDLIKQYREEEYYYEGMSKYIENLKYTVQGIVSTLNQDFSWLKENYKTKDGILLND